MFESYTEAQYRALGDDAFVARKQEVHDLLAAGTLPEGVTDEMLDAEVELIKADAERRNKRAASLNALGGIELSKVEKRNATAQAVLAGEGNVVASTDPKQERHSFSSRNRETSQKFTDTSEYRTAWAEHVMHRSKMPADMAFKAMQERANTPVSINADFSNMTDPTFANTTGALVAAPFTLAQEVQREMRESGVLYPLVNHTQEQGMYAVSELDLTITGAWIGDKEVSPYQADYDPEIFTWGWHQFEARHARSLLAQAVMDARYDQLAEALGECFGYAADAAIYAGNGSTQPRGIVNDLRLVGSDGLGIDSTLPNYYTQRTGTGKGRAVVINVTPDDVDDWEFWVSLLDNRGFNRLYRQKGRLFIADGTWSHVKRLHDDNHQPVGIIDPLTQDHQKSIVGVGEVVTLPDTLASSFDAAEVGDVIGFYGDPKNYTVNTQPAMQLSTVTWEDYETNTRKTRMLTAMDGRVHNPFGWAILKKAASA